MSTWNVPKWGQAGSGTVASAAPFPELYIRNFVNDEGILPGEVTPLKRVVDSFTVGVNQNMFVLSKVPSNLYSPIVYVNGVPNYPTVNYSINSRNLNFPSGVLQTNDVVKVIYAA